MQTGIVGDFSNLLNFLMSFQIFSSNVLMVGLYVVQSSPFLSSIITKKDDAGSTGSRSLKALALIGAGVSGFFSFATTASADEAEHGLECPSYPWPHKGILSSYDHAS